MINIKKLTQKDIGKWVTYETSYEEEIGKIKSWNDEFIFVVYKCDKKWDDFKNYTAQATEPENLFFRKKYAK